MLFFQNIVDSFPTTDLFWSEKKRDNSKGLLIIKDNLKEKLERFQRAVEFLYESGRSKQFSSMQCLQLLDWGGKIESAIMLRELQNQSHKSSLWDTIINGFGTTLKRRYKSEEYWRGLAVGLTEQEVFYARPSLIHELLETMNCREAKVLGIEFTPDFKDLSFSPDDSGLGLIKEVNQIFLALLSGTMQYIAKFSKLLFPAQESNLFESESNADKLSSMSRENSGFWLLRSDTRRLIQDQINISHYVTLNSGVSHAELSLEERKTLLSDIVNQANQLVDIQLNTFGLQIHSFADDFPGDSFSSPNSLSNLFKSTRRQSLYPQLDLLRMGKASKFWQLSEKYRDFDLLIEACVEFDRDKINHYLFDDTYNGFTTRLFEWFLSKSDHFSLFSLQSLKTLTLTKLYQIFHREIS